MHLFAAREAYLPSRRSFASRAIRSTARGAGRDCRISTTKIHPAAVKEFAAPPRKLRVRKFDINPHPINFSPPSPAQVCDKRAGWSEKPQGGGEERREGKKEKRKTNGRTEQARRLVVVSQNLKLHRPFLFQVAFGNLRTVNLNLRLNLPGRAHRARNREQPRNLDLPVILIIFPPFNRPTRTARKLDHFRTERSAFGGCEGEFGQARGVGFPEARSLISVAPFAPLCDLNGSLGRRGRGSSRVTLGWKGGGLRRARVR